MFLVLYNCYCQHRCDIVWSNENLDFHYDARNDIFISWNRNVKLFYLFYPPNFIVISIIIPLILLSDTLDWVSRWRPGSPLWTSSPSWRSSSSMSAWGSTRWNYKFWLALVSSSNELVEHWVHDSDPSCNITTESLIVTMDHGSEDPIPDISGQWPGGSSSLSVRISDHWNLFWRPNPNISTWVGPWVFNGCAFLIPK